MHLCAYSGSAVRACYFGFLLRCWLCTEGMSFAGSSRCHFSIRAAAGPGLLCSVADLSGTGSRQNPAGYTPYSDLTLEIPPVELSLQESASDPRLELLVE